MLNKARGILAVMGIILVSWSAGVSAAADQVRAQAPGFYRMMLGDFEITALNDGVVAYATSTLLPSATREEIKRSLSESGLGDPVEMSYNAFLINTGSALVLVDTGTGGKLDDSPFFQGAGRLHANLRAAGYRPEQVDEIYITHLGPDHIGGLTMGKERAFPNATIRAAKNEVVAFLDPEKSAGRREEWIRFCKDLFDPYIRAGKFATFDADIELVPGIRALATPGHTSGHTSYLVESKGQALIVLGDLVLMGAMQFAHPTIPTAFDADPQAAIAQRRRVFQFASEKNYWIAASHLSFPGLGHVRVDEKRHFWSPANYTISDPPPR